MLIELFPEDREPVLPQKENTVPVVTEYTFTVPVIDGVAQIDEMRFHELLSNIKTVAETNDLPPDITDLIKAELFDQGITGASHYSIYAYDRLACRGPLCKMRKRHQERLRRLRKAFAEDKLVEHFEKAKWGSNSMQFSVSEQRLNKMIERMLKSQNRRVPFYLQLLLRDPKLEDMALWREFLSNKYIGTREIVDFKPISPDNLDWLGQE